jgi:hypothetical protein
MVVMLMMMTITGGFREEDVNGGDHDGCRGDGDDENGWNISVK